MCLIMHVKMSYHLEYKTLSDGSDEKLYLLFFFVIGYMLSFGEFALKIMTFDDSIQENSAMTMKYRNQHTNMKLFCR